MLPAYARVDLAFERGEGVWLIATNGDRYLDFASGVAVNALGHSHPHVVEAITEQAKKVIHVSNLYRIPEGERLADRLCAMTFADKVFFANSGAEAMEGVIKMVRKYQSANGHPERYRIITFEGSFHGRTLATLAAAKNKKHLDGFGPPMDGFDQVPLGDLKALKLAITPETAGIVIEPVQGEGGVRSAPPQFFRELRQICDEHGLLLAFDEVQTGIGRLGEMFGYQKIGVTPDVMALAKGLGAGFPIGAVLATEEAAKGMTPGTHGSTFGGNPLACAVGNAVLDEVTKPGFLDHVRKHRAPVQAASRRDQGQASDGDFRGARRRAADRPQVRGSERRGDRRLPGREAARGRRRRQCRAPGAAADRHRGRGRRGHRAGRPRLHRHRAGPAGAQTQGAAG